MICPLTLDLPDVILTIKFCAYLILANSATTTTTLPRQLSRQRNVSIVHFQLLRYFYRYFYREFGLLYFISFVPPLFHRRANGWPGSAPSFRCCPDTV
jgi:hypothetical protein